MVVFFPFSDSLFRINGNYMIAIALTIILGGAGVVSWLDFKLDRVEEKMMILNIISLER